MLGNIDRLNDILSERGYDFSIEKKTVIKNNHKVDGIVIFGDSFNANPVYYPTEEFLEADEQMQASMLEQLRSDFATDIDPCMISNRDYILEHIYPRLVSDRNLDMVEEAGIIFRPFLDMLIEYYVTIPSPADGAFTSYTLHGCHLQATNLYENDIFHRSIANLRKDIRIIPITDLIKDAVNDDFDLDMYVLSNCSNMYGAASILCDEFLLAAGEILGEPFIIFPSSIHECIAIPTFYSVDLNYCLEMVKEINESTVSLEDRLTDSVYICEGGYLSVFNGRNRN